MEGQAAGSWIDGYKPLQPLGADERARLSRLQVMQVPAGTVLFSPGSDCKGFVVVLSGSVRVSMTTQTGRNLTLYRVGLGETCIQTTLCMTGGDAYSAEGVAETDVRLVLVPPVLFEQLMAQSDVFRAFVFSRFGARFSEMMHVLETIAFVRVDARLAAALLARRTDGVVTATHQELADEIGSAREVVSRQLKVFAGQNLIALQRGHIELIDANRLAMIARV